MASISKGVEGLEFTHCYWDCKMVQSLWKTAYSSSKVKHTVTYDAAILLPGVYLGIYPTELKADVPIDTWTIMIIAGFICNSPKAEILKYPFIADKVWTIHIMIST